MELDTTSTDAMHWAENLVATAKENNFTLEQVLDEGWLGSWFANYWAAIHDPLKSEIEQLQEKLVKERNDNLITTAHATNAIMNCQKAEAENEASNDEAVWLAKSLWKQHYKTISPNFELCDTTAGVISQIDNIVAGLNEKTEQLQAENVMLREALERITSVHSMHCDHHINISRHSCDLANIAQDALKSTPQTAKVQVRIEQLQAENQRLRDALEKIRTNGENPTSWQWDCVIAREALERLDRIANLQGDEINRAWTIASGEEE